MLSATERDAIKLLPKAKYGYRFLPEWMKFRGPPINMTQTKIEFANESYIESLPSASDPARGEICVPGRGRRARLPPQLRRGVVVDRADRRRRWSHHRPVNRQRRRQPVSHAVGRSRDRDQPLQVACSTRGGRTAATRSGTTRRRSTCPSGSWPRSTPTTPTRRSSNRVARCSVSTCCASAVELRAPFTERLLRRAPPVGVREDTTGRCAIWEWPDEKGRYAIGADPSQGMEHGDYASAHVINARNGEVVATLARAHRPRPVRYRRAGSARPLYTATP